MPTLTATDELTVIAESYADFLERLRHSGEKERLEHCDGETVLMPPPKISHEVLLNAFAGELHRQFDAQTWQVLGSNVGISIGDGRYFMADASVTQKPIELVQLFDGTEALVNPALLVEVLSPGTRSRDTGLKRTKYTAIDSLVAYIRLHQSDARIDWTERTPDGWAERTAGEGESMTLDEVGLTVAVDGLYGSS